MSALSSSLYIENNSKRHLERYFERGLARISLLQLHLSRLSRPCQSMWMFMLLLDRPLRTKWSRSLYLSRRLLDLCLHPSPLTRLYLPRLDRLGGISLPHPLRKLPLPPSPASTPRMKRSGNPNTDLSLVFPHSPIEWSMMFLKTSEICLSMPTIFSRQLPPRLTLMVYLDRLLPIDDL
jgi:hypothetical protein